MLAQQPGYWHIADAEGLPTNTVYNIMEDQQGYIYLGTQNGLVKFDGFNFEKINNSGAKASDVTNLQQDSKGNIWFSNFNHELFKMSPDKTVHKIKEVNESNFNSTGAFYLDQKDNLWFNSIDNIMFLKNGSQPQLQNILNQKQSYINNFGTFNNKGIFFSALDAFVYTFDNYPNIKENFILKTVPKIILKHPDLIVDTANNFVISLKNKLIDLPKGMFILHLENYLKQGYYLNNFGMLPNKTIWIATSNGVLFFDSKGNILNNGNYYVEGNNASFVLQDSKGNFWFSTLDNGIFMVSNFIIRNYTFYKENKNINGTTYLRVIKDKLYVGTQNGEIIIYNKNNERSKLNTNIDRSIYLINEIEGKEEALVNTTFINLVTGNSKYISWLGSPKGIEFINGRVIVANNNGLMDLDLSAFYDNKICINNEYILEEINELGKKINTSKYTPNSKILFKGRSSKLFKDHKNRIWCSSTAGIICVNGNTIQKFTISLFPSAVATDFAEDEQGNIYFFVSNVGLYKWNGNTLSKYLTENNGLLSNSANRLLYANKRLWIGTAQGLNAINLSTNKIETYRISDGLLSNVIVDLAYFNHRIWLATYKGLCTVPEDYVSQNLAAPQLYLNNIKINGKEINLNQFNKNNVLKFSENNVEFNFSGINYQSREFLTYKYRLIGLSENWVTLSGRNNKVTFQGLSPGTYLFELKAFNDKGLASNNIIKIGFSIKKPWWSTWWFWTIAVLVLGFLSFYLYRVSVIEKQKQEKIQDELRISQLASLKAQMNPHFMFNALNSIQDFILTNDKKSANIYLGKFSDLMRLILDMSNQSHVTLANELKALNLYLELESVRFENTLEYKLTIAPDIDITDWQLPSMIIQPFVENAFKHGLLHIRNNRKLEIDFKLKDKLLYVTITDNGIGRSESERINKEREKKHTSFATGATNRRLELLNKKENQKIQIKYTDLRNEQGQPSGTKAELIITLIPVI